MFALLVLPAAAPDLRISVVTRDPERETPAARAAIDGAVASFGLIIDRVSVEAEPDTLAARLTPLARPPEDAR